MKRVAARSGERPPWLDDALVGPRRDLTPVSYPRPDEEAQAREHQDRSKAARAESARQSPTANYRATTATAGRSTSPRHCAVRPDEA